MTVTKTPNDLNLFMKTEKPEKEKITIDVSTMAAAESFIDVTVASTPFYMNPPSPLLRQEESSDLLLHDEAEDSVAKGRWINEPTAINYNKIKDPHRRNPTKNYDETIASWPFCSKAEARNYYETTMTTGTDAEPEVERIRESGRLAKKLDGLAASYGVSPSKIKAIFLESNSEKKYKGGRKARIELPCLNLITKSYLINRLMHCLPAEVTVFDPKGFGMGMQVRISGTLDCVRQFSDSLKGYSINFSRGGETNRFLRNSSGSRLFSNLAYLHKLLKQENYKII